MTAANHTVFGALIGVLVKEPTLAVPAAFVSHFLLDMFPHFGFGRLPVSKRNKLPLFRFVIGVDIVVALCLAVFLPLSLVGTGVGIASVMACMVASYAPDALWVMRYHRETNRSDERNRNKFLKFHKRIQWGERSWGLWIEIPFFAACLILLYGAVYR